MRDHARHSIRRVPPLVFVALAVFAGLGARGVSAAPACTITWDGGAGTTNWSTGNNWDSNVLPSATDVVCIPNAGGGVEVVHSTGTDTITSIQGAGGLQVSGGTLDVSGTADPINELILAGGTISGAGTVRLGGTGTWSDGSMSGAGKTTIDPGATLTISGDGSLGVGRTLEVGGTVAIAGDFDVLTVGGPGLVHVLAGGVVRKNAGASGSSIDPPIDNDGTVEATTGTGSFLDLKGGSGSAVSTGTFGKTGAAAKVRLSAGSHTIGPGTFADGVELTGADVTIPAGTLAVSTLTLQAGTLKGAGTVGGDLVNAGGTVQPGASPGILTVDGSYTQSTGGTLETEIAGVAVGSGYDRLAVGGPAMLGGTLEIVTVDLFDPRTAPTYDVVTTQARSGEFDVINGADPPGNHYDVEYRATGVRLRIANPIQPESSITSGPQGRTGDHTPKFRFVSDDPEATFQCRLDDRSWKPCTSPLTLQRLGVGDHVFRVQAKNEFGVKDETPAKRRFTVRS